MKKIIMATIVIPVFLVALFGPFNVYHYVTAEVTVKRNSSFVFELIYDDVDWEIRSVEYIGKKTYQVEMKNDDVFIMQINSKRHHQQVRVFALAGGQFYERYSY